LKLLGPTNPTIEVLTFNFYLVIKTACCYLKKGAYLTSGRK